MAHTGRRSHRNRPGGHRKPKTQKPGTQKPGTRQRTRRQTTRRALHREVPSTVALLADERDFAAMRHYASFAFDDHGAYLREMEG
ncbi:hypothetical protein ACWGK9_41655, partial [Streptomyces rubiginosohelvolus]